VASNIFIAFRYLTGRNRGGGRYLLSAVAGIALSLVPVIVTLIVADGMIRGITDRFIELGTGHLQIWKFRNISGKTDAPPISDEEIRAIALEDADVRGVWRQREGLGVIVGARGKNGVTIRAVEPSFWEDAGSLRYLTTLEGEARIEADNEALLGGELARLTGAQAGKTIRIMTARITEDGRTVPRASVFTVKGIVSSGYNELDAMWCIISYEAGKRILNEPSAGDPFVVKLDGAYKNLSSRAATLNWQLPDNYWVYKWSDLMRSQYEAYEQTRQLLLFIMLLIVIVAAVNVSSATSMLVIERQRDIAVLKTFGVNVKSVRSIFLWGSFLTGLLGSIIGICAGLLIGCFINQILRGIETALNFFLALVSGWSVHILDPSYYLQTIPIIIDWKTVALVGAFTVLCSCAAGSFPARKAGKTRPVELLRKY
jgi:lipoprotein-releasing system permease protein